MPDRPTPPTGTLDLTKSYTARLKTERGEMTCELFAADAPLTVENFINLARAGYYDGTTFHRVIPGFMAQGGDPTGTGSGGPGYTFRDEVSAARRHAGPGVLSMANSGPGTNGSQFFITFAPTPHLDGRHSVFGRITGGMEVLLTLRERDPPSAIAIPVIGSTRSRSRSPEPRAYHRSMPYRPLPHVASNLSEAKRSGETPRVASTR